MPDIARLTAANAARWDVLTLDLMHKLWPNGNAKVPGLLEGIVASAPVMFPKYGLTSPLLVAHAMAQFSHECGAGLEVVENLNYSAEGLIKTWPSHFDANKAASFAHQPQKIANAVYNGRMGNAAGSNDGWTYRGRGGAQTTGREGYQKVKDKTGIDVIGNADLLIAPATFLECAVADFVICGCLPFAQTDDVLGVTKRLNGGTIGLAQRQAWLAKWKAALAGAPSYSAPAKPAAPPSPVIPPSAPPSPPAAPQASGWLQALITLITSIFKPKG
ncbi:MAG: putative glycohydrolase [Rhizobium sp.]|nr:putative glycohydrolase [Rhizobium sp.]